MKKGGQSKIALMPNQYINLLHVYDEYWNVYKYSNINRNYDNVTDEKEIKFFIYIFNLISSPRQKISMDILKITNQKKPDDTFFLTILFS